MANTVLRHSLGMFFMIHDYEYALDFACIKLELHECYDLTMKDWVENVATLRCLKGWSRSQNSRT